MNKILLLIPIGILAGIGYVKTKVSTFGLDWFDIIVIGFISVSLYIIVSLFVNVVGGEVNA